jgi:site-specific DNA recombinase
MMRAALYARFSTDNQNAASTADQLRLCRDLAAKMGAEVVGEFEDAGISGSAMANRPGVNALMALAQRRGCDVVITEHLDRSSRGGSDTWAIFEELESYGVRYVTVNQGEANSMKVGVAALVSVMQLEEGAKKTRRGLEGVVRSGRSAGGCAYGYDVRLSYDDRGERIRGLREINPVEAAVVVRIFETYADGVSPLAIAAMLNAQGVPGPTGGPWRASTIHGSAKARTGVLRNELYRGERVWGRNTMVKNRRSGKRRVLPGQPAGAIQRQPVPDLRIVGEELWERVQDRLAAQSVTLQGQRSGQRRPKTLLGGLIRCGQCGGAMTRGGSGDHLRCSTRAEQGRAACSNSRTPSYGAIEHRVLASIKANLLHPQAVLAAVGAFQKAMTEGRQQEAQGRLGLARELQDARNRIERLIHQVEEGMPWAAVSERHAALTRKAAELADEIATLPPEPKVIALHPAAAAMYRQRIEDFGSVLRSDHAAEATAAIRRLVFEVRFLPAERKGQFELDLAADLAPMLAVEGVELVRATNARSCVQRSHEFEVRLRA